MPSCAISSSARPCPSSSTSLKAQDAVRRDKGRFYTIARGSAMESAALIDVLVARQIASAEAAKEARELVIRVIQMLSKLQQAMAG